MKGEKHWLRLYVDITRDRKLRRHAPEIRWAWIAVLVMARQSCRPGYLLLADGLPVNAEDLSDEAGISVKISEKSLKIFLEQGMLDVDGDAYFVTNWDKRQFASDTSSERVRRSRERNCNVSETLHQRSMKQVCNGDVTSPDTETDTYIHNTPLPPQGEPEKQATKVRKSYAYTEEFLAVWQAYPRQVDKAAAFKAYNGLLARLTEAKLDHSHVLLAVQNYAESCRVKATPEGMIKHASTFFNQDVEDIVRQANYRPSQSPAPSAPYTPPYHVGPKYSCKEEEEAMQEQMKVWKAKAARQEAELRGGVSHANDTQ